MEVPKKVCLMRCHNISLRKTVYLFCRLHREEINVELKSHNEVFESCRGESLRRLSESKRLLPFVGKKIPYVWVAYQVSLEERTTVYFILINLYFTKIFLCFGERLYDRVTKLLYVTLCLQSKCHWQFYDSIDWRWSDKRLTAKCSSEYWVWNLHFNPRNTCSGLEKINTVLMVFIAAFVLFSCVSKRTRKYW